MRFKLPGGLTLSWANQLYATREEAQRAIDDHLHEPSLAYVVEDVVTPEARIRELEAELAQLRDAYDAARQDLDVAKRNVARLESTLAMVQASWAASVASADVARAASAEAHRKAVVSVVRLDRALALGDAMHRAHPSEDWAAYKDTLAALRQGIGGTRGEPMNDSKQQPQPSTPEDQLQSLKDEVERLGAHLARAVSSLKAERDYSSEQYLRAEMASAELQDALRIGDHLAHYLGIACGSNSTVWRVQLRDWNQFKQRVQSRNKTKPHDTP